MRMLRSVLAPLACLALAAALTTGAAQAQTKITVGKVIGGDGFHIPTYIAMDQGFYAQEGLDASFVVLTGKALVTAGLSGNVDFVPIPSGGAQAALSGAEIRYVVGESLKSQWTIVVPKSINKVEELKGKTIGYGRLGGADYDEGAAVLRALLPHGGRQGLQGHLVPGRAGAHRGARNGDIQAALLSAPHAAKAEGAGMKVLLRTGDYIARAGGAFWARKAFVDQNPETAKKFIRAIAKAVMYFRTNKEGSVATLKKHLGIDSDKEAGLIWDELHDAFGAELPANLFREIFESRRLDHDLGAPVAGRQAAARSRAVPGAQPARPTLKDMGYVPTKLDTGTKTN